MTLKEKISEDLKDAMKSGEKIRLQAVRSIRALILEFEKSGSGKEFDETEEIKLLSSAAKKRKESIEQFRNAGREDLVKVEEEELKVIMSYLPAQLSDEEVFKKIKEIAKEIGANSKSDFGRLIGSAMKELKGKAEGNTVKKVVEKVLGEN